MTDLTRSLSLEIEIFAREESPLSIETALVKPDPHRGIIYRSVPSSKRHSRFTEYRPHGRSTRQFFRARKITSNQLYIYIYVYVCVRRMKMEETRTCPSLHQPSIIRWTDPSLSLSLSVPRREASHLFTLTRYLLGRIGEVRAPRQPISGSSRRKTGRPLALPPPLLSRGGLRRRGNPCERKIGKRKRRKVVVPDRTLEKGRKEEFEGATTWRSGGRARHAEAV